MVPPMVGVAYPTIEELKANPIVPRAGEEPNIDMAFDLSSSAVGWAVAQNHVQVRRGKLVFHKSAGMGAKLRAFALFLQELFFIYLPTRIALEKPVMRHGSSTTLHNQMLAIVRLKAVEKGLGEIADENMIPPQTIKRCLKVEKGKDHADNKRRMVELINHKLGLHLKYHKSNKVETDDDIADACAVLEALWVLDVERSIPVKPKKIAKKGATPPRMAA